MKLALIAEIQHKYPVTVLDRANVTGVYGCASVNDIFRVHPNKGHRHRRPRTQRSTLSKKN